MSEKISVPFLTRLNKLAAEERLRAVVKIRIPGGDASGKRQSREERQAALSAVRESATAALSEIDGILKRADGRRRADPNVLGCIPVETTRDGVFALAQCEQVGAILEDQPISLIR